MMRKDRNSVRKAIDHEPMKIAMPRATSTLRRAGSVGSVMAWLMGRGVAQVASGSVW
jgi:hypothetical protein